MLSTLNTILCFAAIAMCVCRLGSKMSKDTTKIVIRLQYVMWLGLTYYLLMERPLTLLQVVTSAVIFVYLIITLPAWRNGPPQHAIKE